MPHNVQSSNERSIGFYLRPAIVTLTLVTLFSIPLLAVEDSGPQPKNSGDVVTIQDKQGDKLSADPKTEEKKDNSAEKSQPTSQSTSNSNRSLVLVFSLTVFVLAVFVGFEVIAKVPPTLHTPLMSGSNAISGITVIGAIIAAGNGQGGFGCFLGLVGTVLAMINVVGGFVVTHRMLKMFKRK